MPLATLDFNAVTYPNRLIFVDFPSTDPEASARFYNEVFGWEVEPRPAGVFHRIVPGRSDISRRAGTYAR